MVRKRQREVVETGAISFFYRPRVEREDPRGIEDVQRAMMVLAPEGSIRQRIIAIGRKRIPRSRRRVRFLAFVDQVDDSAGVAAALGADGRLPSARPAGTGRYEIVRHDGHTHLHYTLDNVPADDHIPAELGIERSADWIVTVGNPDPTAWGLDATPVTQLELFPLHDEDDPIAIALPFPPELQARFGEKRFIDATPEFLDHAGAELVLIGAKK